MSIDNQLFSSRASTALRYQGEGQSEWICPDLAPGQQGHFSLCEVDIFAICYPFIYLNYTCFMSCIEWDDTGVEHV